MDGERGPIIQFAQFCDGEDHTAGPVQRARLSRSEACSFDSSQQVPSVSITAGLGGTREFETVRAGQTITILGVGIGFGVGIGVGIDIGSSLTPILRLSDSA